MKDHIEDDFDKMDFKQLRAAVRELNDSYIKLKRLVEDALFNIDETNLSAEFHKKLGNNEAKLAIAADKISSMVSNTDLENALEQYTTIEQTADAIKMTASEVREYADNQSEELTADLSVTAGAILSNVSKVMNKAERNYSSIRQTADKIAMIVVEYIDTSDPSNYFTSDKYPPTKTTPGYDAAKLCKVGSTFYYFNSVSQKWKKYDEPEGIKSLFEQTPHGFVFSNDVKINGDLITYGRIVGIDIKGSRFYGDDKAENGYFKIGSEWGDIGIFENGADKDASPWDEDCIWGIRTHDPLTGVVYMYSHGQALMGYNKNQNILYPMGYWKFPEGATLDLSDCKVIMPSGLHLDGS